MAANPFGWVEIPTRDLERAKAFFNKAFGYEFEDFTMGDEKMAFFPFDHSKPGATGALVCNEHYQPSNKSTVVYFEVDDVDPVLSAIATAGGEVLREKMSIGEYGYVGIFIDTEGNRLGLHSNQ